MAMSAKEVMCAGVDDDRMTRRKGCRIADASSVRMSVEEIRSC